MSLLLALSPATMFGPLSPDLIASSRVRSENFPFGLSVAWHFAHRPSSSGFTSRTNSTGVLLAAGNLPMSGSSAWTKQKPKTATVPASGSHRIMVQLLKSVRRVGGQAGPAAPPNRARRPEDISIHDCSAL